MCGSSCSRWSKKNDQNNVATFPPPWAFPRFIFGATWHRARVKSLSRWNSDKFIRPLPVSPAVKKSVHHRYWVGRGTGRRVRWKAHLFVHGSGFTTLVTIFRPTLLREGGGGRGSGYWRGKICAAYYFILQLVHDTSDMVSLMVTVTESISSWEVVAMGEGFRFEADARRATEMKRNRARTPAPSVALDGWSAISW